MLFESWIRWLYQSPSGPLCHWIKIWESISDWENNRRLRQHDCDWGTNLRKGHVRDKFWIRVFIAWPSVNTHVIFGERWRKKLVDRVMNFCWILFHILCVDFSLHAECYSVRSILVHWYVQVWDKGWLLGVRGCLRVIVLVGFFSTISRPSSLSSRMEGFGMA